MGAILQSLVDMLLTPVSAGYFPVGYISEQVFPVVTSAQTTGKLGIYGKEFLRIENTVKAGAGKYRRVSVGVTSTTTYSIDGHGLEDIVTAEDYRNKLEPFDAERDKVIGLTHMLWLEKEQVVATALTSTSTMTQNVTLSGVQQYSDFLNSDPISDFATARSTIVNACGFMPNVAIMDVVVWNLLRFHPQILDAMGFKWAQPGGVSLDQLAVAMGVDKILLGQARYNSSKEGQADTLAAVWGKHIVFAVIPEKAALMQQSLGYMMRYDGEAPRKVYKFPSKNPPNANTVLVEDNYQALIRDVTCGYLIANAIA